MKLVKQLVEGQKSWHAVAQSADKENGCLLRSSQSCGGSMRSHHGGVRGASWLSPT